MPKNEDMKIFIRHTIFDRKNSSQFTVGSKKKNPFIEYVVSSAAT